MPQNRRPVPIMPLILIGAGLVIIGGLLIWYLTTGRNQNPGNLVESLPTEDTYENIPRVGVKDAKAAYDLGTAVFVDVRDVQSYQQSHIKGALSIPLADIQDRLTELNRADWIITYCT